MDERSAGAAASRVVAVVDGVLAAARQLLGCELVALNRVEPHLVLTARTAGSLPGLTPGAASDRDQALCSLLLQGAPAVTTDAPRDPVYGRAGVVRTLGLRTYVGVPVRDEAGQPVATLCGFDRTGLTVPRRAVDGLAGLAAVLTPYARELGALDAAVVRGEDGWVVQGAEGEDSGPALAAVLQQAPAAPPVEERAWLRDSVTVLQDALARRVQVEQALGVLSERLRVPPREAWSPLRELGGGSVPRGAAEVLERAYRPTRSRRPGEARPGEARPGEARPREGRPGEARPGDRRPGRAVRP